MQTWLVVVVVVEVDVEVKVEVDIANKFQHWQPTQVFKTDIKTKKLSILCYSKKKMGLCMRSFMWILAPSYGKILVYL